jgi:hypothetical protein
MEKPKCWCGKDINAEIHISCAICTDVELCLECFSSGVEFRSHMKNHDYRVRRTTKVCAFDPRWTKDEELGLLESVDRFGLGNWKEVASHLGSKDAAECEEHYLGTYVNALPNLPQMGLEGAIPPVASIPPSLLATPSSMAEHAGYLPRRDDYEKEFDNGAETAVRDIVVYDDDPPYLRQLKGAMLDIYNGKLDRRMQRHRTARRLGLHDAHARVRRESAEVEQFRLKMRPFAQFVAPEEHVALLEAFVKIQKLRQAVRSLQAHRARGLRTLEAVAAAEQRSSSKQAAAQARTASKLAAAACVAQESISPRESQVSCPPLSRCCPPQVSMPSSIHACRQSCLTAHCSSAPCTSCCPPSSWLCARISSRAHATPSSPTWWALPSTPAPPPRPAVPSLSRCQTGKHRWIGGDPANGCYPAASLYCSPSCHRQLFVLVLDRS